MPGEQLAQSVNTGKVVVVEDHAEVGRILQLFIKKAGHAVVWYNSAN